MLKKENRVDKSSIDRIFKEGRFVGSPNLTFKYILSPNLKSSRISFIAPKSVAKLAVKRNYLRRRGYDVLKKVSIPPSLIGVFIFKKIILSIPELEDEVKKIFSKIN